MVASITLFANNAAPTGPELDGNFQSYTPMLVIPCVVSGTNALTLTPFSGTAGATPTLTAYQNYLLVSGVVANSNSAATTIRVGSLAALPAYKDTALGPVALSGSELIAGCAFTALYDSALNSGNGGWHVYTGPNTVGATLNVTQLIAKQITASTIASIATLMVSANASIPLASITTLMVSANASIPLASITTLMVGTSLTCVTRINSALGTLSYSATPANLTQDQTFALAGAQLGDTIGIGFVTQPPGGVGFTGFLSAAGTITLRLSNPSASSISAASITVRASAMGFT